MSIYILNVILTLIICSWVDTQRGERDRIIGLAILLTVWTSIYALRNNVGSDWSAYYKSYTSTIPFSGSLNSFMMIQRDQLFALLEYLTYYLSNGNWIVFQYLTAVITYLPVLLVIYKKADKTLVPCILYILAMYFYSGFNGMRQAIASSIIFAAFYLCFLEKKYLKYIILMIVAYGFHSSAIFATPFHFLAQKRGRSLTVIFSVILMLFAYFNIEMIWPSVISLLKQIGQYKMANDYAELGDSSSSMLRMVVSLSPVLLAMLNYGKVCTNGSDGEIEFLLLIYSSIFMLFSTRYWVFARVSSLISQSVILFIPKLENVFAENSRRAGIGMIILLYFFYMIAMLLVGEGGYYPYHLLGVDT